MFYLIFLLRFKWTYLVAGAALLLFGVIAYFSAHPSQPVEIDGRISHYVEETTNGSYKDNTFQLAGDDTTYTLDKNAFHPALPDEVFRDGKISIWIDMGSTTIIALTLYDEDDKNPITYTTSHFDNPQTELSDSQGAGITAGIIGVALLIIFGAWFAAGRWRSALAPAAAGMASTKTNFNADSSAGMSSDGKWYWDLTQWRPVSGDGRYRWDGAQWQELGTVYSAKGAPPPPAG